MFCRVWIKKPNRWRRREKNKCDQEQQQSTKINKEPTNTQPNLNHFNWINKSKKPHKMYGTKNFLPLPELEYGDDRAFKKVIQWFKLLFCQQTPIVTPMVFLILSLANTQRWIACTKAATEAHSKAKRFDVQPQYQSFHSACNFIPANVDNSERFRSEHYKQWHIITIEWGIAAVEKFHLSTIFAWIIFWTVFRSGRSHRWRVIWWSVQSA